MTRVTTDVDVLNELFTAGVVSVFGDIFLLIGIMGALAIDGLAAGRDRLRGAAADRAGDAVVPPQRPRVVPQRPHLDRADQRVPAGAHHRDVDGAAVPPRARAASPRSTTVNRGHRDANIDSIYYYAVFYPAIEVIGALSTAMIIWFGGNWVLGGHAVGRRRSSRSSCTRSASTARSATCRRSSTSSRRRWPRPSGSSSCSTRRRRSSRAARRSAERPAARRSAKREAGHIVFENVSFAYNGTDPVLQDVSFEVKPGERVGIVGATGAGKSTIINLLLRFYDVTERADPGRRRGHPRDGPARAAAAVQPRAAGRAPVLGHDRLQHPARRVGDQTMRRCGRRPQPSTRAVHRALPGGYGSAVAERGATLSVGQKQLLSFARALAFDPRILVLDEATSSVDTETELLIRDALHTLMAGRTTIAIAHRLSTIQDMDKILVLHRGQLREVGHPPGAAGAARDLLQALPAAVSRDERRGVGSWKLAQLGSARPIGVRRIDAMPRLLALALLKSRSTRLGRLCLGFQPRRRTVRCIWRRPICSASLQLHR